MNTEQLVILEMVFLENGDRRVQYGKLGYGFGDKGMLVLNTWIFGNFVRWQFKRKGGEGFVDLEGFGQKMRVLWGEGRRVEVIRYGEFLKDIVQGRVRVCCFDAYFGGVGLFLFFYQWQWF